MTTAAHIVPLLETLANTFGMAFELRCANRLIRITPPHLGHGQDLDGHDLERHLAGNQPFNCSIGKPRHHVWAVPLRNAAGQNDWLIAHTEANRNGITAERVLDLLTRLAGIAEEKQRLDNEIEEMAAVLDQSFEELAHYAQIEELAGPEHYSTTQLPAICKSLQQSMDADLVFVRIPECPQMTLTVGSEGVTGHVDDTDEFIQALIAQPPPDDDCLEGHYFCVNDSRRQENYKGLSPHLFRYLAAQPVFEGKPLGWIGVVAFNVDDFFRRGQMHMLVNTANQIALMVANAELLSGLNRLTRRVEDSHRRLKVDGAAPQSDNTQEHHRMVEFLNRAFAQMSESIASGQTLLAQSARLASVGQLASVFAHEVKQPLTALSGMVQVAQMKADRPDSRSDIQLIAKTVDRMITMVKRFGSFSRPVRHRIAPIGLNKAVMEVYQMVKPQMMRQNISGELDLDKKLSPVMADVQGLQQVVLNLMTNAVQAMEALGDRPNKLNLRTYCNGKHICLDVEDTGTGIDPDQCLKIFEPYYTTKSPEHGTGLGLAVARDIMAQFGGTIEVASQLQKGSRFTLKIPLTMSN